MGKRPTSKHAASGFRALAVVLRRLLVALFCGGLVFALSGFALPSATAATRLLSALGAGLVVYAGIALAVARPRGAQTGRRRAVAAPVAEEAVHDLEGAEPSFLDEALDVDVADAQADDRPDELPEAAPDTEADTEADTVAGASEAPVLHLEELIRQAMAEELANDPEQDQRAEADPTAEPADEETADETALVPDAVTHDLVPISSLHEARAEAERASLQRIQATVRGLSVRTGDDPVAVDVLARVVAAVDRLMAPDSFARPVLSETAPLLAAAAAATPLPAPSASESTPQPAVPAMRASDMPVTELTTTQLPVVEVPVEAPMTTTQPIEAVVVEEDPDLVLPIPAPPKPQPAPRGRRLRRNSVA